MPFVLSLSSEFSTKPRLNDRLASQMTFLGSLKVVRLLLTVCVSVWLAGGCLLGCGKMAMAASRDRREQAAVEAPSCHSAQEHHCCSKPQRAKQSTVDPKLTELFLALTSVPRSSMSDCPLAMSATAITAKVNSNSPESDQTAKTDPPLTTSSRELRQLHFAVPLVPNRGPTYLRHCVFLI